MAQRNTAIRGVQIRDGEIGADQLATAVNASLALADSALQSIASGSITETELSVSVNASLDLADSALQSLAFAGLTDGTALVASKYLHVSAGGAFEFVDIPTDLTGILEGAVKVEDLTGNADTSLTLANAPVAGSFQLFINGLLQQEGSGKDYVISGTSVTLAVATVADDLIIVHYIDAV